MDTSPILSLFVPAISAVFLTAFTLYIVRVVRGPSIPDMVLAVNCLSFDLAVFIALLALYYSTPFLVLGSIFLALWAFILDIFVAKYFVRREVGE